MSLFFGVTERRRRRRRVCLWLYFDRLRYDIGHWQRERESARNHTKAVKKCGLGVQSPL